MPPRLTPPGGTFAASPSRFTGVVHSTPIVGPQDGSLLLAGLAQFTPGARTNWHSHALGQALYVTEGQGVVVTRDGTAVHVRAGDTVWTPPGEEHWHGAVSTCCMSHVAMLQETAAGDATTWLEPVDQSDYEAVDRAHQS